MNRAKAFETRFKADWLRSMPQSFCYRLYDTTSGYRGISNVSDFICYSYPYIYLLDCKSSDSNTFSVDFRQYDDMIKYKDIKGLCVGIIWWSIPNESVVFIPVQTFEQLRKEGKKSFNFKKMINDPNYKSQVIPSNKLRTYLQSDYSVMKELAWQK